MGGCVSRRSAEVSAIGSSTREHGSCSCCTQHGYDGARDSLSMASASGCQAWLVLSPHALPLLAGSFPSGWGKSLSPCNGWLCLTGQAVIRAEKHDTRIFIRGHIVHEPRMPSERRVEVLPEALPGQVLTAQEIGIQRLQEGIVDRDRPNASRGDDMRRGSLTQDGVEERIPAAIAEIDQGCGGWQFLQGPVDMGTMATMDYHARSDSALTQDLIDIVDPLFVVCERIGIDLNLPSWSLRA